MDFEKSSSKDRKAKIDKIIHFAHRHDGTLLNRLLQTD